MIGRFYGLTGVNLVLSPVSVSSYKNLVKSMDTAVNRPILSCLKRELEELINFLNSLNYTYETAEARRAYAKLLRKRYDTEEERVELENFLSNQTKTLSPSVFTKDNSTVELSNLALKIVKELYSRMDRIKFFYDNIAYSDDNSGVSVFGEKLYTLRVQSRASLNNRLFRIYKKNNNGKLDQRQLDRLRGDIEILKEYVIDTPIQSNQSISNSIQSIEDTVVCVDSDYFNNLFDVNCTEEDYYNVSEEVLNLGLVGFTPYTKQFFKDFLSTVSLSGVADLYILPDDPIYGFLKDLEEVLSNFDNMGKAV